MNKYTNQESYFGFTKVDPNEKSSLVGSVFSSVAKNYDLMNDLMSFGVHRLWKKEMLLELTSSHGKLLDVAGGTGDISKLYYEKTNGKGHITISDINPAMLEEGRKKLLDLGIFKNIEFVEANAENLPFEDNIYDYYTIAFGIRNVTHIDKALKEAYRILRPGGKIVVLEFSHIENTLLKNIYDFYSFNVIPKIGKIVANDEESYKYLVESIRQFPKPDDFAEMIKEAGFSHVSYRLLNSGIVAIHKGFKIGDI